MMGLGLALFNSPTGTTMLADYAPRAESLVITTNEHGLEKCSFEVPLSLWEAFSWYDPNGLPWVKVTWNGLLLAAGRLEDRRIQDGWVSFQALGAWRTLMDAPYTALWSTTKVGDFRPMLNSEVNTSTPDRYTMDTNNRLYITPQKNATLGTTGVAKQGSLCFQAPDGQSKSIVGIQFDYELVAPAANWRGLCRSRDAAFGGIANVLVITSAGAGTQTGSLCTTIAAAQIIDFTMDFNAADAAYAGETGVNYWKITNLRMVSSTTNVISTTLTANRNAGTNVTATVGSTARMYVGQRIIMSSGNVPSESVLVLSIGGATTFNATFVNNYVIGDTVRAHVIYADQVAADMAAAVNTLNAAQLSSSTALIQSPALDLTDEVFEDANMADVLTKLASYGDNASPPNMYEVGVDVFDAPQLFFRPIGSAGSTWYVDVSDIDVERSLEALANSVYAAYDDANNRTLRSAANADSNSVARYGLTRRTSISPRTTSSVQAGIQRDASLADTKDPTPRAGIVFSALYDAVGARHMLFEAQANDTIIIRNLPPALATTIDKIRSFRIGRTEYHADDDTLTVEPAQPLPSLEFMLSRLAIGVK
jgi:hypothetical protein